MKVRQRRDDQVQSGRDEREAWLTEYRPVRRVRLCRRCLCRPSRRQTCPGGGGRAAARATTHGFPRLYGQVGHP